MKIFIKIDNNKIDYCIDECEKNDLYDYIEFDVNEDYSDEELISLCEKMKKEFDGSIKSLSDSLEKEIDRKKQLLISLKDASYFKVVNTNIDKIHMLVYLVYRGNFNDERLLDSLVINVESIKDKELSWVDLYLNHKKDNKISIAMVYLEGDELYLLENNNGIIKVIKKHIFSKYYSDDYDEKYFISTSIYCSKK